MNKKEAESIRAGDCVCKRNKYSVELMYIKKIFPNGRLWVVDYVELRNDGLSINHGYDVNFEYSSSFRWVKRDVSTEFLRWWAIQKMTDTAQRSIGRKLVELC